ncbi:bifunctional adenosylcobinamide kinase/adenosylcobinamide-phosphate guanylyltransferase [Vibrio lamellibrachiae]|uniref:bifunctional adenosylcobinamide kinase/adenosylcobinamide-phosphate guanylyltransferase n=1 Tax=Vibrio lamellibrachiae TaxID=2910253 RepID=UPI003D0F72E4
MTIHLVLGGARSGKSTHAEGLAKFQLLNTKRQDQSLHYVATAQPFDDEMKTRIKHHQNKRGQQWHEHEVPIYLAKVVSGFNSKDVVLIDCLTLWLNNIIFFLGDNVTEQKIQNEIDCLLSSLDETDATIILVSNEVGLGVVPLGEVSRLFVDHAGWMNQKIAVIASHVDFIAAGIALTLKPQK